MSDSSHEPKRRLGRLIKGADREAIENKLSVPSPRAASKRVALDILRRRTKLAREVRDHGRRKVRFLVGKTTLRAPERQLRGEPEPAGIGIADDKGEVIGRQRPALVELVRRPQPLHARSPTRVTARR